MDKSLRPSRETLFGVSLPLVRCMIRSIVPLLEDDGSEKAQILLNCINILRPKCDIRQLQALTFYRAGKYSEAMGIYGDMNDMQSKAFFVLCQRAMGEESWVGGAREVNASGDELAIALIEPWVELREKSISESFSLDVGILHKSRGLLRA